MIFPNIKQLAASSTAFQKPSGAFLVDRWRSYRIKNMKEPDAREQK